MQAVVLFLVVLLPLHGQASEIVYEALAQKAVNGGTWQLLVQNAGVSAMHMTLTRRGTVVMYDRTDYGPSQLRLAGGICRRDPLDLALTVDCYAHSIEYNILSNRLRPLEVLSDTWCSSAAFLGDGTLVSTGGFNDGSRAVRQLSPCATCDWSESFPKMAAPRWYASNQILPDNSIIVVGGRRSFSYEFVPSSGDVVPLSLLAQTNVPNIENNLYPFVLLCPSGNLFIFANQQSILLNYRTNQIVKSFPAIPGNGGRNYPSSGSAVLLPLTYADGYSHAEVMVCGGAPDGAFQQAAKSGVQMTALNTCGRMKITDATPVWSMETMPSPRVMNDMLVLPNGEVLIINGAQTGAAGWRNAANPNLRPVLYRPDPAGGGHFYELAASTVPRLYHSTANVLPDGRILVGGSNPNVGYVFSGVPFPTELRIEAYSPYYLDEAYARLRPSIAFISNTAVRYGTSFRVQISVKAGLRTGAGVEYRLYAPPFTTHGFSMNQRQLLLAASPFASAPDGQSFLASVTAPPNSIIAPAGYYILFVVYSGIPSVGAWLQLG